MADLKISELAALAGGNLVAADELAIVDDSASETKKITVSDLITNGVTVISDDTIPGAKILFAAGDIATAALATSAITTEKLNNSAVTAAKLANESTVDLVTTLPTSGVFTGQLAVDTDDNSLYCWDGSAWLALRAPDSISAVSGSTTGEINIVTAVSGTAVTISATLDNTTSAAQFFAGPTGSAGALGYRTIVGSDLPTATTTAKGGVVVNGNGLAMDGDTIEINNAVTSSGTHHVVTYDTNGLITGGRTLVSSDLPIATATARGAVIPGDGLTVDVSGNLSVDNSVAADTYTKVTVTAEGLVSAGTTLLESDIPDHSAAKLTSGTIPTSILANSAVTGVKLADQSTTKFGGALGSDNVTIFPSGDYKGQFFYDETTADLYIYTGSAYVPITLLTGNLVNAGVYNASTNLLVSVTTAGSSAGFTAGSALPAPTGTNLNHYVVVSVSGTGGGAAPAVALAPPDMLLSQGVGAEFVLIDVSNAIAGQTAANISVVAAGNIIATNVQSALQELDTEKLQLAGGTMTGDLNLGTGVDVVFEGSAADDYETTLAVTNPTADRTITLPNVTGTVVTTGDTGSVTSTMLLDGTIVNADINASAEIAVSKLANGTARQLLQTDAGGTGVEFTSNVDVPGTLDVAGAVTLDSTLATTGLISANGKISFPLGTAAAPSIYFGSDTNTGVFSPAGDKVAITTAGTQRVVVDNSGKFGIGTASPEQVLHIAAASESVTSRDGVMLQSTSALAADTGLPLVFTSHIGNVSNYGIASIAGRKENATSENAAGYLQFATGNSGGTISEKMRIDSSGRVGVGTTSPSVNLDISPASGAAELKIAGAEGEEASIRLFADQGDDAADTKRLLTDTSGNFKIQHYANSAFVDSMVIDSSGGVRVPGEFTAGDGTIGIVVLNDNADEAVSVFAPNAAGQKATIFSDGRATFAGNVTADGKVTAEDFDSNHPSDGRFGRFNWAGIRFTDTSGNNVIRLDADGGGSIAAAGEIKVEGSSTPTNLYSGISRFGSLLIGTSSEAVGDAKASIDSSSGNIITTGKVGIGEQSPAANLEITPGTGSGTLLINHASGSMSDGALNIEVGSTGALYETRKTGGLSHVWYATGAEQMRIASSGNVGFGTSSPNAKIDVLTPGMVRVTHTGTTRYAQMAYDGIYSKGHNMYVVNQTNHDLIIATNNSERMRLDSSGRLLIGASTSPTSDVDVKMVIKSTGGPAIQLQRDDGTTVDGELLGRIVGTATDGSATPAAQIAFRADGTHTASSSPGRILFQTTPDGSTSPSERMRINSLGRLGVIAAANSDAMSITSGNSSGTSYEYLRGMYGSTTVYDGTLSFRVFTNGNIQNTNNSYGAISDIKLKENIVNASSQWDDLKAIQVRNYNFIQGQTHTQIGVVAQEVETVSPGLVTESPDRDENDNDLGTVTKSVNYSVLYMKAVKALQEAMERIETLEQRLTDAGIA